MRAHSRSSVQFADCTISGCLLLHLGASHLMMSYVGNIGAAVMSAGHLMKLTDSNELDEEQYDRIRSAGGTVDEVTRGVLIALRLALAFWFHLSHTLKLHIPSE